jgi:AraC-like DNA-binding protein
MTVLNQELLAGLDLKVLAIQRITAGRWWNFRHVISPFSRLWLILGGRAVVRHHGRNFTLEPGCLHLVPPFTVHDCACLRQLDHYHLHFVARMPTGIDLLSMLDCEAQLPAAPRTLDYFKRLETLLPDRRLPCFDPARDEYRRFPVAAEQTAHELPPADWFEANATVALLLSPFLKQARVHEGVHARATQQFLDVQQFIHEHMRQPLVLGDLARVAGLHPTYFSDRFRELVGVRPLEYLMRRRIERAQYLLLTSRASVKQVAVEVGIPDAAYFTRVFTRICRTSPSDYRTSHSAA